MDIEDFKKQLSHKYDFIKLIGSGGFADVYLARDKFLERDVAIKILLTQYSNDSEIIERFVREAKLYAKLEHKNLIPVYDTGIIEDYAFIIMKYINGESLKSHQQKQGKLSVKIITIIIKELASTLEYIHSKGIIHRDIKPGNILIERETNKIFLADFGIARADSSQTLTQSGLIIGTPNYLSPEQIKGGEIDHRSDIYALGSMLYELVSGKTIFSGQTSMEILYQHVNEPPEPIGNLVPNLPREIKYIISKCIEKKPADRFQKASEIQVILENRAATFISRYLKSLEKRKGKWGSKTFFLLFLFFIMVGISVYLLTDIIIITKPDIKKGVSQKISSRKITAKEAKFKKPAEENNLETKKSDLKKPGTIINQQKTRLDDKKKPVPVPTAPSILKFSSFPTADVYWNDIKLGNTTQIFFKKFNPGKYTFKFVIPEYQSMKKEVIVESDTEISVHQKFAPYGTITITAKPFAQFYVNGRDFGNNPIFKKKIPVGEYTIKAVKKGYITKEKKVEINPKKLTNIYFKLEKEEKNDQ